MSLPSFADQSVWIATSSLAAHLVAGIAAGVLYFRGLWWNTLLFTSGGRVATSVALMIGRFALLGGLLMLASQEGAWPLLALSFGIFVARLVVVRRLRSANV